LMGRILVAKGYKAQGLKLFHAGCDMLTKVGLQR
jgi:hypothetical protein